MIITYAFVVTIWLCYLGYKLDGWKQDYKNLESNNAKLDIDKQRVETELKFLKESIVALYAKPVYVNLNQAQIEAIAQLLSDKMKEPSWVN